MKTYSAFLFIALSFFSCKKDRTCNCTTSVNGATSASSSFVIKHVTKNQALARSCVNTTQTTSDSTGTKVTKSTCTLAK